jgi:hypothetical protein
MHDVGVPQHPSACKVSGMCNLQHIEACPEAGLYLQHSFTYTLLCFLLLQVPDKGKFLKGLAVVDDVAYFGISDWQHREQRDDPRSDSELAAFCLRGMSLLWRQQVQGCRYFCDVYCLLERP